MSEVSTDVSINSVFAITNKNSETIDTLKSQILQLGASLDRGQAYNPTSGPYYADRMAVARLVHVYLLVYISFFCVECIFICVICASGHMYMLYSM